VLLKSNRCVENIAESALRFATQRALTDLAYRFDDSKHRAVLRAVCLSALARLPIEKDAADHTGQHDRRHTPLGETALQHLSKRAA
jgi:hypothetical protein